MGDNGRMPLVSIVITSYNRAGWIEKAIESALAQDYPHLEIIISDNASTDNSHEVIRRYVQDRRVRYSANATNIGMAGNFKKATNELATGEYILYISSDDYLYDPKFISASIALIEKNPAIRLVFGKFATFNLFEGKPLSFNRNYLWDKEVWKGIDVFLKYHLNGFLCFGGCLMKRQDLIDLNAFDIGHINFDVECILKIMLDGDVGFINKDTYVFIRHDGNQSSSMTVDAHLTKIKYVEEVYSYARTKLGPAYDVPLAEWRNNMLGTIMKGSLYFLKMYDNKGFRNLFTYIKTDYPDNFRAICKDRSWYARIKLNKKVLLFLYKHLKPGYYYQEFATPEERNTKYRR